jgi:hypothetical protein
VGALAPVTVHSVGNFNGQAAPMAASSPGITIRFFNYAHVPDKTLNSAKDRITAIYQTTGIELNWIECPAADQDPSAFPACTEVWDSTHLFLRLLPQAAKTTSGESVGESLPGGRMAKIYWDRVREKAGKLQVEPEWGLAYVLSENHCLMPNRAVQFTTRVSAVLGLMTLWVIITNRLPSGVTSNWVSAHFATLKRGCAFRALKLCPLPSTSAAHMRTSSR